MQPLKEVASDIDVVAAVATATIVVLSVVVVAAAVVVVTKFSLILQKALFHGAKSSVRTIVVVRCGATLAASDEISAATKLWFDLELAKEGHWRALLLLTI